MDKVSREQATQEVEQWLDRKKVYASTREAQKDSIETLIEAMMNGDLTLDEKTNELNHKLLFPLDEVKELKYKSRLNDKMMRPHLQGVKSNDADGRLNALTACLTSQPKAVIENLDSADKRIMMSIAVFFL
jgi:hypothetical protein